MLGQVISHYEVVARIGGGGMGEVFEATDTLLHRTVALKVLPPEKVADPERRARFLIEARAASSLNHPYIVTIHDVVTTAEGAFVRDGHSRRAYPSGATGSAAIASSAGCGSPIAVPLQGPYAHRSGGWRVGIQEAHQLA